ncbi:MAG: sigma-70 family RNA polymerase sigma factor [Muribaculaceae bacterium]|nr:sigma-70 family RNA polymerase sigma factor [Muribaculaceae bacterium]MDE6867094.1 sigma-70 family RNA polymerase sigma factor [Muribaculaceae bacterium]
MMLLELEYDTHIIKEFTDTLKERICSFFAALSSNLFSNSRDKEREFADILRDYGNMISGICFSYADNAEDIKDLRQDILINIWKGLNSFRGDSSLSTWLYRVALNTCVSTIKTKKRKISTSPLEEGYGASEDPDYASNESIEWLHYQISTLSPLDKAIITMWLDERSYEEIATVTGISRNNVAVRINRIKQKISKSI